VKRAIRRFVGSLTGPKRYMFLIGLVLVCIVALCIGIYIQFFYVYSDTDPFMIGINIGAKKTEEEIAILKADFNSLFNNSISIQTTNPINVDRIDFNNKNYVITGYNLVNEDENFYSVNAQIPSININTSKAKEINAKIKSEFYDTANNIMRKKEGHTIYTVSYVAYINEDVLSLVIKASLKEQDKAEKVSVKTYNYSITDEKLYTLEDFIKYKETTKEDVQTVIDKDVKTAYNNAKIIAETYGNLYERDLSSNMYKVENTDTFFLTQDGYVYIIYAYGNKDYTNEMDLIIF
jgi:hypothetical protein